MFKRPYTPSIHKPTNNNTTTTTTTNTNHQNHQNHRPPNTDDLQRRQAEANRSYHEEIVLKQAQMRARNPASSTGCSFVDKFADFVTHKNRMPMPQHQYPPAKQQHQSHAAAVPKPRTNANAVSSLIPPSRNATNSGSNANVSAGAASNCVSVVSGSGINGFKAGAKKTPVILLAARGPGKHAPISLINGTGKAGAGGVTLLRVNAQPQRNQRQVIVAPEQLQQQQQQQQQQQVQQQEQTEEEAEQMELAEEEELEEDLEDDDDLSSSTAQILRKFRIPKGTALTAKSGDNYLAMPTPTPSPPGGVNAGGSAADVGNYIENEDDIIEELHEDDLVEEIIDEEQCEEQPELEEEEEEEEATTADNDGLDLSSQSQAAPQPVVTSAPATQQLLLTSAPQPPPLQLQTVSSNGTVTYLNLPPNTILLQSADGSIIAATQVPHPNKAGQHQLIALPGNVAMAEPAPQATAAPTQTLLLTADGTAIPIMTNVAPQQQQQQQQQHQQHQQQQQQQQQQAAAAAAAQLFAA
ncbi:PHD finger protein rhinoceros [Drosophila madeirensis]|uniref:PHD finger protein rhinoceros n=1 Tax=Drosophila madeirensis TaxID=30013 RepID=A0AAU9GF79_DROMD